MQGREGLIVSKSGFLGPNIADVVESSPEALVHARRAESARTGAFFAAIGSGVLLSLVGIEELGDGVQVGVFVGGLGLAVYSGVMGMRSQRETSRAIWEYNGQIPR